jgi:DNA-binding MarR family transcriptional regulator
MHNIRMNASSDLHTEALLAATRARDAGLTQQDIASKLGASQSQVSRVLAGHAKRRSRLFDQICKYVFSTANPGAKRKPPAELTDALHAVWDGTPEHAQALALVIRSLGVLGAGAPAVRDRQAGSGRAVK